MNSRSDRLPLGLWLFLCIWPVPVVISMRWIDIPIARTVYSVLVRYSDEYYFWYYLSRLGGGTFWVLTAILIFVFPNYIFPAICRWSGSVKPIAISRRYHLLSLHLILTNAIGGLVVNAIKYITGRPRPTLFLEQGNWDFQGPLFLSKSDSFPSGHTQVIWGWAFVLISAFPRFRLLFVAVAIFVSFSRILVLRHWVSDVLTSIWLAFFFYYIFKQLIFGSKRSLSYGSVSTAVASAPTVA